MRMCLCLIGRHVDGAASAEWRKNLVLRIIERIVGLSIEGWWWCNRTTGMGTVSPDIYTHAQMWCGAYFPRGIVVMVIPVIDFRWAIVWERSID